MFLGKRKEICINRTKGSSCRFSLMNPTGTLITVCHIFSICGDGRSCNNLIGPPQMRLFFYQPRQLVHLGFDSPTHSRTKAVFRYKDDIYSPFPSSCSEIRESPEIRNHPYPQSLSAPRKYRPRY